MTEPGLGNVYVQHQAALCCIVLNRPGKLNALTAEMIFQCRDALAAAQADPKTRVIMLRGEGRAFCAGDDLSELAGAQDFAEQQKTVVNALQDITRKIMLGDKPVIAAVQGFAVGAAFSWVFNCDFSICSESAQAFFPELKWGVSHTGGASALAPRLLGANAAREALLLCRRFSARELLDLGAVTRVVADGGELAAATELARQLAELPAQALAGAKRLANRALAGDLEATLSEEAVLAVSTATSKAAGELLARSRLAGKAPTPT